MTALLLGAGLQPALAQRGGKAAKNAAGATREAVLSSRSQPLFGGLSAVQAEQALGPATVAGLAGSFASRAEASQFFSNKGYEYLVESQRDTAAYRFNLAWVLDPNNSEAYHGLAIVASSNPSPEQSIQLLEKGLVLDPTSSPLLSDLGSSYLIRYEQGKKKKDLKTGTELLQKATTQDPANAAAWQQLGRAYYYQEQYAQAWEAVHKGQGTSISSVDFGLISDLLTHLPDPKGTYK
ncbi:tetratricopeptide repeat protein [Hymenobacter psychrophilus]|uniref:tetratricopeptide repeat protein n=1 Tax=Hymenobacter psychrophilus TaxID=651662 RepID=UPI000B896FEF|nr:tetratricopeptide repeat protein [Hymenobacter psychrophilus]